MTRHRFLLTDLGLKSGYKSPQTKESRFLIVCVSDRGRWYHVHIMPRDSKETISAQVVLRPASGKAVGQSAITAENIDEYAPSPDAVAKTTRAFHEAGFEVGPVVGTSFSITAPVATFEKVFDIKLQRDDKGGFKAVSDKGKASYELPMPKLSKSVVDQLEAVTFTRPPDFGPSSY